MTTERYGRSPALDAMEIQRIINPPVTWIVAKDGEEIMVPLAWGAEERANRLRRHERRKSALKGWQTRRAKRNADGGI